jgi:glutamate-5-semialdehyde dehydrogenase
MSIAEKIRLMAAEARQASFVMARLSSKEKNELLLGMAEALVSHAPKIIEENRKDLLSGEKNGLSAAMLDRLMLDGARISGMAGAIFEVAALPDPVGEVTGMWKRPNDLMVGKMRIPLGVIGIIYESRPNVTSDAAALCLKSGNAVVLRGGSEAIHSNVAIASCLKEELVKRGLPTAALTLVPFVEREGVTEMLKQEEFIDVIIPRGGESLIRFVVEHSKIPVIKHYKGVCHIFVDASADVAMAREIIINAKVQRPGVCNALETLLIHSEIAESFVPFITQALSGLGVELRGDPSFCRLAPMAKAATEEDWHAEYLDLILSVAVVEGMDGAIDHINRYGSLHTESIITGNYSNAQRFIREVNSGVVMVNE